MTKEHPILFSTPMVHAILEGRKTMTRRIVKFPKDFDGKEVYQNGQFGLKYSSTEFDGCFHRLSPKWQPEERLWVRETFTYDFQECGFYCQKVCDDCRKKGNNEKIIFAADWKGHPIRFKPSIHMPKVVARIWLKVINVKAEKLQGITGEDALTEGIERREGFICPFTYKNYLTGGFGDIGADGSYETLWKSINGTDSWEANPWVWVIEFRVLSTTGKPLYKKLSDVQGV